MPVGLLDFLGVDRAHRESQFLGLGRGFLEASVGEGVGNVHVGLTKESVGGGHFGRAILRLAHRVGDHLELFGGPKPGEVLGSDPDSGEGAGGLRFGVGARLGNRADHVFEGGRHVVRINASKLGRVLVADQFFSRDVKFSRGLGDLAGGAHL